MDHAEQKALSNIDEYGCHIIHVLEEDGLPPFSYSVGIWKSSSAAELIVVGLDRKIAHLVINDYNARVRDGWRIEEGQVAGDFLKGFDCLFREMGKAHYPEYLGWCRWLYGGDHFPTLQMIYPNTKGIWPWQADASEWFKQRQPVLAAPAEQ